MKSIKTESSQKFNNSLLRLLAIIMFGIIMAIIVCALVCIILSKPIGDDFGAINFYRADVWFNNTFESIKTTGRYGQSISGAVFYGLFGRNVAILLPLLTMVWFVSLAYVYTKSVILPYFKIYNKKRVLSILFSLTIVSLAIFLNSNTGTDVGYYPTWLSFQYLFWSSGIVTYFVPLLIFLSVYYLLFLRANQLNNRTRIFVLGVVTFFVGIFNEISPATFFAISLGMVILPILKQFRNNSILQRYRLRCLAIAVSSALALASLLLSPGSQERQVATGANARSIFYIALGVCNNMYVSITQLIFRPADIILVLSICLIIAIIIRRKTILNKEDLLIISKRGIIIGLISQLIFLGSLGCSFLLVSAGYGEHAGIITRTLLLPQVIYTISLIILFTSLSILAIAKTKDKNRTFILMALFLLVILSMPSYIIKIKNQLESSVSYHSSWNEQEKKIEASLRADKNATIYLPNSVSGLGVGQNLSCKNGWLYEHIQEYYNVKKICSSSDIGLERSLY